MDLQIGFWNAWIFMSVFIIQMIIVAFPGKLIKKRTHIPSSERKTVFEKYISFIANFFWFVALAYSVFLPLHLNTSWFYSGLSIFIIGSLILMFATIDFMSTQENQVIQKGVYKYSRHPMYLSTFLICVGTGIAAESFIFLLLTVIMVICFRYEALLEEKYCITKYQGLYKEYMKSAPRWFGIPK
jgi:protein-S-isoprenylcysteine O-methyltransferase Ste14